MRVPDRRQTLVGAKLAWHHARSISTHGGMEGSAHAKNLGRWQKPGRKNNHTGRPRIARPRVRETSLSARTQQGAGLH